MLVDGEPVRFRSAKAKELMALCLYRQGCPASIHEIVECMWGEETAGADSTGYRRTIKELTDTLRDYAAEELLLRARGQLAAAAGAGGFGLSAVFRRRSRRHLPVSGQLPAPVFLAEPMVYTLLEKKQLMLARLSRRGESQ